MGKGGTILRKLPGGLPKKLQKKEGTNQGVLETLSKYERKKGRCPADCDSRDGSRTLAVYIVIALAEKRVHTYSQGNILQTARKPNYLSN
jgi:hypothetical protein